MNKCDCILIIVLLEIPIHRLRSGHVQYHGSSGSMQHVVGLLGLQPNFAGGVMESID